MQGGRKEMQENMQKLQQFHCLTGTLQPVLIILRFLDFHISRCRTRISSVLSALLTGPKDTQQANYIAVTQIREQLQRIIHIFRKEKCQEECIFFSVQDIHSIVLFLKRHVRT